MALTIIDEPFAFSPIGQQLMFVVSSDNVAETGFRYKVSRTVGGDIIFFYTPPNPDGILIVDCSNVLSVQNMNTLVDGSSVHSAIVSEAEATGVQSSSWSILEAWEVAGILTDDPDSVGAAEVDIDVWDGTFQASDGYKPSLDRFTLDGQTKRFLSDRAWDTHIWDYAETFGFTVATNKVFIQCTESDWGVMNMITN